MSDLLLNIRLGASGNISELKKLRVALFNIKQLAGSLAGIAIGTGLIESFRAANQEAEKFVRSMNAVNAVGTGQLQFKRLADTADQLGLSLSDLSQSYTTFKAASVGTELEGFKAEQGFKSTAAALSVLGVSTDQSKRAFTALAQMMSKGQVYSEELKQQLAENLPGAIQIFARALNVSQAELLALVKAGKVGLPELSKFFGQLDKEYGKVAKDFSNPTLEQSVNRLKTQFALLSIEIGKTGVWQGMIGEVNKLTNAIRSVTTETDSGLNRIQSAGIELNAAFEAWGQTMSATFREADASLNEFLSTLRETAADGGNLPDLGAFLFKSMADLPANIKALATIIEGEIGKAAVDIETAFRLAFNAVQSAGSITADAVVLKYTQVVQSIKALLGDLANSVANQVNALGNAGSFIPGFQAQAQGLSSLLQSIKQQADNGARELALMQQAAAANQQAWAQAEQDIIASANRSKQAWDDTIQSAIEAAQATSKYRQGLSESLKSYAAMDSAEQRIWAIRQENLKSTQSQISAQKQLSAAAGETKNIMATLAEIDKNIRSADSGGQEKSLLDVYSQIVKVQRLRQEIDQAQGEEAKKAAINAYSAALKQASTDANSIKNAKEKAKALRLLTLERERLAELGVTDKEDTIKVGADVEAAREAIQYLRTEINGTVSYIQADVTKDAAEKSISSLISWANSQRVDIPVYFKQMNSLPSGGDGSTSGGSTPGFRLGTVLPGYGGGDRIHALLEPGEAVLRKEVVRRLGPDWINQQNASVNSASMAVTHAVNNVPRMASGGIVPGQPINIHVPGQPTIKVSGSRDQAKALADLLGRSARAL